MSSSRRRPSSADARAILDEARLIAGTTGAHGVLDGVAEASSELAGALRAAGSPTTAPDGPSG